MTKEEVLEKVKFHAELKGLAKNTQDEYYTKAKMLQDFCIRQTSPAYQTQ